MWSIFKPRTQAQSHVSALYDRIVETARRPQFYTNGGVPDTPEGRFELISLHVIVVIRQLNKQGERGKAAGQSLFEYFFKDMDYAMREMGIGDTSIGKKVRAMAEVFYGRFKAYAEAADAGDEVALAAAVRRNVFGDELAGDAAALARYFLAAETRLARADLLAGPPAEVLDFPDFNS
ncbi:ubiquinol-cytochrome C chaperone family protein [Hyphobacterium sp.]|uniref:ubiquinol-cytochrome C chaperone family protein n=1 Tax=Hyphobacterium sp. TaxID=2004662 RepID=UPI003BA855C0